MDTKQSTAVMILRYIMPALTEIKKELVVIVAKFEKTIPYYKKFNMLHDKPDPLSIEAAAKIVLLMEKAKAKILKFQGTFDENDLPKDVRRNFLLAQTLINKDSLICKDNVVYVGNGVTLWHKSTDYVLKTWPSMNYKRKVEYSIEAYKAAVSYFKLIDFVGSLERDLK